jgi:hypothetical protein
VSFLYNHCSGGRGVVMVVNMGTVNMLQCIQRIQRMMMMMMMLLVMAAINILVVSRGYVFFLNLEMVMM